MGFWGRAIGLESNAPPAPSRVRQSDVHAWRVLHLSRSLGTIASVLEVQLAAGMHPTAATLAGMAEPASWLAGSRPEDARPPSLFSAWREVKTWRQRIAGNRHQVEVIHAHEFPAGMAGIRMGVPLVYDVHGFIDEPAAGAGQLASRSWLGRSFRSAEQFVFSRANAVVVHSADAYREALRRGAGTGNLFIIPEPRPGHDFELHPVWLHTLAEKYDAVYSFVLCHRRPGRGPLLPPGWQPLAACF